MDSAACMSDAADAATEAGVQIIPANLAARIRAFHSALYPIGETTPVGPEDEPESDTWSDPDPKPESSPQQRIPAEMSLSAIRDVIDTSVDDTADAPEQDPVSEPAPPPRAAEPDRWSALRTALEETEPSDEDDMFMGPEVSPTPRPLTPIERIRAREAGLLPAQEFDQQAAAEPVTLYDEREFDTPEGPTAEAPKATATPEPAAPVAAPEAIPAGPKSEQVATPLLDETIAELPLIPEKKWDTPADHEMSRGGKFIWRALVFGSLLAGPIYLLATSPFSPEDTVRHYAAAAGCTASSYVGLTSAAIGDPGYHMRLDENANGVACEPLTERKLQRRNTVTFIRPGDY